MSARTRLNQSIPSLLRMLRAYVDLEASGRTLSARALAERIGFAGDTGIGLRRVCVDLGWLAVLEPPCGKDPGRLTVTAAGHAALLRGAGPVVVAAAPRSAPLIAIAMSNVRRAKALRVLRLVADAEAAGATITGHGVARLLGWAASAGVTARADLIQRGWVVVAGRLGSTLLLRLTDAGRLALADAPTTEDANKADSPAAGRKRRCLCCGRDFDSSGPGNRICPSCLRSDAYRTGDDDFSVRL